MGSDDHFIRVDKSGRLRDDTIEVLFRKIFTPAGERLELESPRLSKRVRLDAIALESLSWQHRGTIATLVDQLNYDHSSPIGDRQQETVETRESLGEPALAFTISNEFAEAGVQVYDSAQQDRMRIEAPKLGYSIVLTALEVESLTVQHPDVFTEFLKTPYGPSSE